MTSDPGLLVDQAPVANDTVRTTGNRHMDEGRDRVRTELYQAAPKSGHPSTP